MSFFDDLDQKMSNVGDNAIRKTKDSAVLSELYEKIKIDEERINEAYRQIGQSYVEKHIGDKESEYAGMMDAIKEAGRRIEETRKQILVVRGVVICANCGAEVSSKSAFCTVCGTPVPRKKETESVCSKCGARLAPGAKVCAVCGTFTVSDTAPEEPAAEPVVPVADPSATPSLTCSNCGAPLNADSAFCTNCGTPVNKTPSAPSPEVDVCKTCGNPVKKGSAFCIFCGASVEEKPVDVPAFEEKAEPEIKPEPQPEPKPEPEPQPEPAPVPPAPSQPVCVKCGKPLTKGAMFCIECGTPVAKNEEKNEPAPPAADNVCAICGEPLKPGAAFCVSCGNPVPKKEQPADKNVCKKCGAALLPGTRFCIECGTRIE